MAAVLPALWIVQGERGWVSEEGMSEVAELLELTPAYVKGVVTFYTMYHQHPVGKYFIQVCTTSPCGASGAEKVVEALLAQTGCVDFGATSPDVRSTLWEFKGLGAAGIAAWKTAQLQPVLLPASVYALGKTKHPDARAMIDAGLAVVLATDFNPGSSPTPSIPMVLSLAATQMKMTPAEAITAATINAAHSLGRGAKIGSLEPGKRGDFILCDCADYRELAYWFGLPLVHSVYVAGARVV